ncbi:hypothetical protein BP00DRAFT_142715 [Aspergillus indologenus CBS 114.80]|uniref:Uncharacterized protein n=1 Tax=Aspergillus indologenus CBS 114.80 TaxID=1450541 RepID=A0A2V5IF52_9EURO|nr:hypothetical protein BP00DRAFT_142715 [Aspergillus indologenus CBS 114.80]
MSRSLSMRLLLPLLPLPLPPVLRPAKRPPLLRLLPPLLRKYTSTIVHSQSLGAIPILSFCIRASRHWSQFSFYSTFLPLHILRPPIITTLGTDWFQSPLCIRRTTKVSRSLGFLYCLGPKHTAQGLMDGVY